MNNSFDPASPPPLPEQTFAQDQKPRASWFSRFAAVFGLVSLGINLLLVLILFGGLVVFFVAFGSQPGVMEKVIEGKGPAKIAWIKISGVIMQGETGGFSSIKGAVDQGLQQLKYAREDEDVKAVIIALNTPGGTISGSDVLHHEILRFKEERPGVPVIAFLEDVAASGGYYVAVAADEITALPTCVTGSIGVVIHYTNFEELYKFLKLTDVTIKSGAKKDMGSPTRPLEDEERAIFQAMIDEMYERFLDVIKTGRGMELETLKPLADGRIYTAVQALDHNLIDNIGYREDVIKRAKDLAGLNEASVIQYPVGGFSLLDLMGASSRAGAKRMSLEDLFDRTGFCGVYYLWRGVSNGEFTL